MKSAKTVSQYIFDYLHKNGLHYVGFDYEDYYSLLEKKTNSDVVFEVKLRNELRRREILVCFGVFGVFFIKDAVVAPVDLSEFLSYRNDMHHNTINHLEED